MYVPNNSSIFVFYEIKQSQLPTSIVCEMHLLEFFTLSGNHPVLSQQSVNLHVKVLFVELIFLSCRKCVTCVLYVVWTQLSKYLIGLFI